jgi:hypothetical protein
LIDPTQPPPPTARYFPFHEPAAGSHTSILISESKEGFRVAATRQKAGSNGATAVGGAPGNGNAPGPADSARVIVVSVSFSDFS